jgi:hypothetical protein
MSKNVFMEVMNNNHDRHFGGTNIGVADPYISGYHFIKWITIPKDVVTFLDYGDNGMAKSGIGNDPSSLLEGACISVTPPGGTIEKTEFTGLGGIKFSAPTSVTYANSITLKFLEFSHLPVLSIIHAWCRMIRDYRTGTSHLGVDSSSPEYTKENYAGTLLYWTTKPDGQTVEYSACYTGLFPLKDPQDSFSGDFTAVDKLEIDIEFNVDYMHHESWVHSRAQDEAYSRRSSSRSSYINFKNDLSGELA